MCSIFITFKKQNTFNKRFAVWFFFILDVSTKSKLNSQNTDKIFKLKLFETIETFNNCILLNLNI